MDEIYRLRVDKAEDTKENTVLFLRMAAADIESGLTDSGDGWSLEKVADINAGR